MHANPNHSGLYTAFWSQIIPVISALKKGLSPINFLCGSDTSWDHSAASRVWPALASGTALRGAQPVLAYPLSCHNNVIICPWPTCMRQSSMRMSPGSLHKEIQVRKGLLLYSLCILSLCLHFYLGAAPSGIISPVCLGAAPFLTAPTVSVPPNFRPGRFICDGASPSLIVSSEFCPDPPTSDHASQFLTMPLHL